MANLQADGQAAQVCACNAGCVSSLCSLVLSDASSMLHYKRVLSGRQRPTRFATDTTVKSCKITRVRSAGDTRPSAQKPNYHISRRSTGVGGAGHESIGLCVPFWCVWLAGETAYYCRAAIAHQRCHRAMCVTPFCALLPCSIPSLHWFPRRQSHHKVNPTQGPLRRRHKFTYRQAELPHKPKNQSRRIRKHTYVRLCCVCSVAGKSTIHGTSRRRAHTIMRCIGAVLWDPTC